MSTHAVRASTCDARLAHGACSRTTFEEVEHRSGKKIGEVEDLVLEKQANSILFAVVSFGGFLGVAEKYHPVPWASLDYDENRNSYVVDFTREQLQAAPAGSVEELTRNDGRNFRDQTYDYYKVQRYWE